VTATEPGKISAQAVAADIEMIRRALLAGDPLSEIRNPHVESPVPEATRQSARASSVLIAITDEPQPQVLLTKRQVGIRFGGHLCFPGGIADPGETVIQTALREAEEEIGLVADQVEVLGSFGCYFSQAGYRIDPVVGVVAPDFNYTPEPSEVASIHWVPLEEMLNPASYKLTLMREERGYFGFDNHEIHVGGPTVSLMIGLLEWLHLTGQMAEAR
tara:strand:- start:756 stop:1403 length:648 start_codon:yes stop_codon:yes gene_type:complete